ncbi:hypothetical protein O4220_17175 [Rhodococcus ruber]|uniref:Integral membrane protein n=1 Tax=Rhodococcus ruber TaxID=1830 RepID=A0ABT4MGY1_9NOCA|nr:hypothetical protein [Rhodococcus ruber]MCZ4520247.1 hypothetical protein [Rhodococcus ruber]
MTISTQVRVSGRRLRLRFLGTVGCAIAAPVLGMFSGAAAWSVVAEAEPNMLHLFGTQLVAVAAWVLWIGFWSLAVRTVADVHNRTEYARGTVWAWTIVVVAVGIAHAFGLAYAMVWTIIPLGSLFAWMF